LRQLPSHVAFNAWQGARLGGIETHHQEAAEDELSLSAFTQASESFRFLNAE
jgi:hypothetical protein